MIKQLLAAAAALALAAPVAAQAQDVPSYAATQSDQQIQGRVTGFDGAYSLQVRDDNGYVDNVELHDGTIINPTGITLAPGMVVSILGDNGGSVFDADEIDTPYTFDDGVPFYAGHAWNYYGPTVGLNFFFGNTGWWHRPSDRGGFARGVAFDNDRNNNNDRNDGERNAPPARAEQPVHFAPTQVQPAQRFAPPAERISVPRPALPNPIARENPVQHFAANNGGAADRSGGTPRESHGDGQPRERR